MTSIYLSEWNPRGVRRSWDRTSVTLDSARHVFGKWVVGSIIDACAWFDEDDTLRVLVADTEEGRRFTYRKRGREFTIQSGPRP